MTGKWFDQVVGRTFASEKTNSDEALVCNAMRSTGEPRLFSRFDLDLCLTYPVSAIKIPQICLVIVNLDACIHSRVYSCFSSRAPN